MFREKLGLNKDIKASDIFTLDNTQKDFNFKQFGMLNTKLNNTIVFLNNKKSLNQINKNSNISGVITTEEFISYIEPSKGIIISQDPMSLFYSKYIDLFSRIKYDNSYFAPNAKISSRAIIAQSGVIIKNNVIIEEGVIIKEGVEIGENSIIRAGCIIGGEGFEIKKIYNRELIIPHNKKVMIGKNVEVQYNSCIDKGLFERDTIIEDDVKIDNLCHIAHNVKIGKKSKIAAKVMIAGSSTIGTNVWIGPGSNISSNVLISNNARVTIGSTVIKNVDENQTVTGYIAQNHKLFLKKYLYLFK